MERIEIPVGDTTLTFKVAFLEDSDMAPPWENSDGHGPVSEWTTRDKKPGEAVLCYNRASKRYYDWAEATRIAKRDNWGISEEQLKAWTLERKGVAPTKKMIAQQAVQNDFDFLYSWANNGWGYVVVLVTLLDQDGDETDITESLGGVETWKNYHYEQAMKLAEGIAEGMGTEWDVVTVQTYRKIKG